MRISDWSSDVCSSDLHGRPHGRPAVAAATAAPVLARRPQGPAHRRPDARPVPEQGACAGGPGDIGGRDQLGGRLRVALSRSFSTPRPYEYTSIWGWQSARICAYARSEEDTFELQSLMANPDA